MGYIVPIFIIDKDSKFLKDLKKKKKKKRLERNSKMYRNCMSVLFHTLKINVNGTFYSVGLQICDKLATNVGIFISIYQIEINRIWMNFLIKYRTYGQNLSSVLKTGKISHDLRSCLYWKMKPKI